MNTIATQRYTANDLLDMPNGDRYELVNGQLVERNMGWEASLIGARLLHLLATYCDSHPVGRLAMADAGYQCFRDEPERVRKPDVSLIRFERLPPSETPGGHCPVAPDLAVEVISPRDLFYEVEEKVAEYLAAGVRLVWVITPPTRTVRIHRVNGSISVLTEADELNGEDILPGFHCPVASLFTMPQPHTPSAR